MSKAESMLLFDPSVGINLCADANEGEKIMRTHIKKNRNKIYFIDNTHSSCF